MTDILGQVLMTQRRVHLTVTAADRILDALEWHQWIHKVTGETLRSWSPDGARPLLELWQERVDPALERVLVRPECSNIGKLDEGTDAHQGFKMVLDYDFRSEQFEMKKCKAVMTSNHINRDEFHWPKQTELLTTLWGESLDCGQSPHVTCRFYV
jgi:hypothetical protein